MQIDPEPTKWGHFVPRVYYKGFSEIKRKRTKEKLFAWVTDVESHEINNCQRDIYDFCAENNLYELHNDEENQRSAEGYRPKWVLMYGKAGAIIWKSCRVLKH